MICPVRCAKAGTVLRTVRRGGAEFTKPLSTHPKSPSFSPFSCWNIGVHSTLPRTAFPANPIVSKAKRNKLRRDEPATSLICCGSNRSSQSISGPTPCRPITAGSGTASRKTSPTTGLSVRFSRPAEAISARRLLFPSYLNHRPMFRMPRYCREGNPAGARAARCPAPSCSCPYS